MDYQTFVSKSHHRGYTVTRRPEFEEADITRKDCYIGFVSLRATNIYGFNPNTVGKEKPLIEAFTHTPVDKRNL